MAAPAFLRALLGRLARSLRPRETLELVLYTKADCPLCDEMKGAIARARTRVRLRVREVDIASDPELQRRHGLSIPVLEIGGRPAFKGRLEVQALERKIERHLAGRGAEGASPERGARGESGHG